MTTDFWAAARSAFERPGEVWKRSSGVEMHVKNGMLQFVFNGKPSLNQSVQWVDTSFEWTRVDPPAPTLVFEPDGEPRTKCGEGAIYYRSSDGSVCRCCNMAVDHRNPVQHYRLREDAK